MAAAPPPKQNASPALDIALAYAVKGVKQAKASVEKAQVFEKISAAKEKAEAFYTSKKDLVLVYVGFNLVLNGVHFPNLVLCTQVVLAFLYQRISGAVDSIRSDLQTAAEKMKEEKPAEAAPPKEESTSESSNKHAKKREAKKNAAAAASMAKTESMKDDAETAVKLLKALDSEKLAGAATQILVSVMACVLIIHGGLARKVAVAILLVNLVVEKVTAVLDFPGYETMEAWTKLLVRLVLYCAVFPLALVATRFTFAMDAAALGATMLVEHGCRAAEAHGKLPKADEVIASSKGLLASCGVMAFGILWQSWSLASDAGLSRAFWNWPLLPVELVEAIVGSI